MRLIVEVRALTGAGSSGLTMVPLGRRSFTGRKHPPLVGMRGSVRARTAKHAAAREPDGTQLSGPRTCGLVPSKSKVMVPFFTIAATSIRIGLSRSIPSLSR